MEDGKTTREERTGSAREDGMVEPSAPVLRGSPPSSPLKPRAGKGKSKGKARAIDINADHKLPSSQKTDKGKGKPRATGSVREIVTHVLNASDSDSDAPSTTTNCYSSLTLISSTQQACRSTRHRVGPVRVRPRHPLPFA